MATFIDKDLLAAVLALAAWQMAINLRAAWLRLDRRLLERARRNRQAALQRMRERRMGAVSTGPDS